MKKDEKLEKEREERRKLFLSWDIENDLPCEVGDYVLTRIDFPTMEDRKTGKVKTESIFFSSRSLLSKIIFISFFIVQIFL